MRKQTVVFFVMLAVGASIVWGGGRKDNESRYAEDMEGFTDSMYTAERKPGKYNFYIEAKDKADNVSRAGPANIWIDPASDLPLATIVNPSENMRVQGNLNIVGIAKDDDGVDYVEFVITRGRDGKGQEMLRGQATGSDFWSYFLDTGDTEYWTDGVYTITAWAVDINGLSGISGEFPPKVQKKHQVYWHLDRKKPETVVTSHEVGALVSGKIRLQGTVFDGNGMESFVYSMDGGEKYVPVKLKYNKRTDLYEWQIDINTKIYEDGPMLIWYKAKDGQGSLSIGAHLLLVNNLPPDVRVVYPPPNEAVGGVFTVAGYAEHPIGLKSLTWKMGKETGEFPLIIGNPWWSKEFDIRGVSGGSVEVEIRAEDVSGNVTVRKQKYKVDQKADMPTVTLIEPVSGVTLDGHTSLAVKGTAKDNQGVAAIMYSLNSEPAVELPCTGYFQFTVNLYSGTHVLDVWAKDVTGVEGPKVTVRGITVMGLEPELRISALTKGSGKTADVQEFYTGKVIEIEPKMSFTFSVYSAMVSGAWVTIGNRQTLGVKPRVQKEGPSIVEVPIPADIAPGLTRIELRAIDRNGREATWEEYAYFVRKGEEPSGTRFTWVRPNMSLGNGQILLSSADEELIGLGTGLLMGAEVRGAGSDNLYVEADKYGRIKLQAYSEGSFGPLTLRLTTWNDQTYESEPFGVTASIGPSVIIPNLPDKKWVKNEVPIQLSVNSSTRLRAIEWSADLGRSWLPLAAAGGLSVNNIQQSLDISAFEDGSIGLMIRAVNENHETTVHFTVYKSTQAPTPELIVPTVEAPVNGTIKMGFALKGGGQLKSVTYRKPAQGWGEDASGEIVRQLYPNPEEEPREYSPTFLEVTMDSLRMPLDENMVLIFEDEAGNRGEFNAWHFIIDQEMDIPRVYVNLPLENEVITQDFVVSGVMFDDDAIKQIYWHVDDEEDQIIEAEYAFSIPIALSSLTDNEHVITVVAEDIYGVKSEPVKATIRVSLNEPTVEISYPLFDTVVHEEIEITGTAFDENEIEMVEVSLDSGLTFNKAIGAEEWSYPFNTKILKDGPHVLFIRVTDKYDVFSMYAGMINVDNTPPEIVLDSPGDGLVTTGKVTVMGQTLDPNLEEVYIELRSLEGNPINEEMRIMHVKPSNLLKEEYNLSNLRDGIYNMEIVAIDKAINITRISRNIELARESTGNFIEVLYPLENEELQGEFNLYGFAGGVDIPGMAVLRINGTDIAAEDVTKAGFFRFSLNAEQLGAGVNTLVVYSQFSGDEVVESSPRAVVYQPDGPWVTIDSFGFGDFAYDRPYLFGRSGYVLSPEDAAILADRKADKDARTEASEKKLDSVELSFDNGRTFVKTTNTVKKDIDWIYRLETGEMAEGTHHILVKATMKNEDTAITRITLQVDKTAPMIRLISPQPGEHYNQNIVYSASATDDVELAEVSYHLRIGDKALYEIPGILKGLYFEGIIPPFIRQALVSSGTAPDPDPAKDWTKLFAGGATYMDFGMGVSFFDDNVKLQLQYGFISQELFEALGGEERTPPDYNTTIRYGGHVLGLKLLANVYALPFGSFMGPDWDWLSLSVAVGANFSLFDLGQEGYTQSGQPTIMSALLAQLEFPKVTIPKRTFLRTFSLFTEGQLWFVPTDVPAEKVDDVIKPHLIMGVRMYVF